MKWLWLLHKDWKERARKAREEVEFSRRELERTRVQVVTPLAEWRQQNHFARLIHDSLLNGRE